MVHKLLQCAFSFSFSNEDMFPLMAMQASAQQDSVLRQYFWQNIMSESIMRQVKEAQQASVMAMAVSGANRTESRQESEKERGITKSYSITYYNPVLKATEVLEAKSEIKITDLTTRTIEESLAAQSVLPLYSYIGQPLMKKEVVPWKLQEILAEREYGTPPPPPAGAAVAPVKVVEQKEKALLADKKKDEELKVALIEAIDRKEKSELRVEEEILILEETVEMLRRGEEIDKVIERLPPLSRARYLLVLRKKNLHRQAIIALLLKDAGFLKSVKKKLELFTTEDLINMFKILRGLQKKK